MIIDISTAQRNIKWAKARAAGVEGVIVQVSQGGVRANASKLQTRRIEYAEAQLRAAKLEGVPYRAVYHFAHPKPTEQDALDEAAVFNESFLKVAHLLNTFEELPFAVLDYELFTPEAPQTTEAIGEWCSTFLEAAPLVDTLYTGIRRCEAFPEQLTRLKLWVSWYPWGERMPRTKELQPKWEGRTRALGPWKSAMLWQYTSSGMVSGIRGRVDLNVRAEQWK